MSTPPLPGSVQNSVQGSAIRCHGVTIDFSSSVRAVDNVNLEVRAGEIVSLIGPSGCGKTSLLRLMAELDRPTAGQVVIDPPASGRTGEVSFVFQQPSLLSWRTALENVTLPLELIDNIGRREQQEIAATMLEQVELSDARTRYPHQLSGGMKMRVSLARALVTRPRLLLLDEPFAALDDMLRSQLGELLLDLWQQHRFTTVLVTHNIAEAILMSNRLAIMRQGRLCKVTDNPLLFPRTDQIRSSAEFAKFYGVVSQQLRGVT